MSERPKLFETVSDDETCVVLFRDGVVTHIIEQGDDLEIAYIDCVRCGNQSTIVCTMDKIPQFCPHCGEIQGDVEADETEDDGYPDDEED